MSSNVLATEAPAATNRPKKGRAGDAATAKYRQEPPEAAAGRQRHRASRLSLAASSADHGVRSVFKKRRSTECDHLFDGAGEQKDSYHIDFGVSEVFDKMRLFEFDFSDECKVSWGDCLAYRVENMFSADPNAYFKGLLMASVGIILTLGVGWYVTAVDDKSFVESVFMAFSVSAAGGYDATVVEIPRMLLYSSMILSGLILNSIFIGMITEMFELFVERMSEGKTKAVVSGHTLILGWNETTVRVLVQIALLRNVWLEQNMGITKRIFPWTRVRASTPVARSPVVVMNNQKTKEEMQELISAAFAERGIKRSRTCIGRDIVCRVGDPTSPQDLMRVGANRAIAILLQMTDVDIEHDASHQDCDASNGEVANCTTLRALLALRVVLFTSPTPPLWEELRVVAQLARPSKAIRVLDLGVSSSGRPILNLMEMSQFLNELLFRCAAQPGLSYALLDMLNFEGVALRLRIAKDFQNGGKHIIGKTMSEAALLFENAAVAGIVHADTWTDPVQAASLGLAPDGDHVIRAEDRIIFVSGVSMPTMTAERFPRISGVSCEKETRLPIQPANLLVCGWRPEWDDASIFAHRLMLTCSQLSPGSSFVVLSMKAHFAELMEKVCAVEGSEIVPQGPEEWLCHDCLVGHIRGDAAEYESLEAAIISHVFDRAVVISTDQTDRRMTPLARDNRVMSILLILRSLQLKHRRPPLHVIGENALDSTSLLAIGPTFGTEKAEVPDFVNVHAIRASALAQALAYPRMQPAVGRLYVSEPSSPNLRIIIATDFVPPGKHKWGSIVQLMKERRPDDVLLGIRGRSGELAQVPGLSQVMSITKGDRFMIISRSDPIGFGDMELENFKPAPLPRAVITAPPSEMPGMVAENERRPRTF